MKFLDILGRLRTAILLSSFLFLWLGTNNSVLAAAKPVKCTCSKDDLVRAYSTYVNAQRLAIAMEYTATFLYECEANVRCFSRPDSVNGLYEKWYAQNKLEDIVQKYGVSALTPDNLKKSFFSLARNQNGSGGPGVNLLDPANGVKPSPLPGIGSSYLRPGPDPGSDTSSAIPYDPRGSHGEASKPAPVGSAGKVEDPACDFYPSETVWTDNLKKQFAADGYCAEIIDSLIEHERGHKKECNNAGGYAKYRVLKSSSTASEEANQYHEDAKMLWGVLQQQLAKLKWTVSGKSTIHNSASSDASMTYKLAPITGNGSDLGFTVTLPPIEQSGLGMIHVDFRPKISVSDLTVNPDFQSGVCKLKDYSKSVQFKGEYWLEDDDGLLILDGIGLDDSAEKPTMNFICTYQHYPPRSESHPFHGGIRIFLANGTRVALTSCHRRSLM